jgi:hypothetical protein
VVALFLQRNDVNIGSKDNNGQMALDWARNQGSNTAMLFSEWPSIETHYRECYWKMQDRHHEILKVLRKARKKKANSLKRPGRGMKFAFIGREVVRTVTMAPDGSCHVNLPLDSPLGSSLFPIRFLS